MPENNTMKLVTKSAGALGGPGRASGRNGGADVGVATGGCARGHTIGRARGHVMGRASGRGGGPN